MFTNRYELIQIVKEALCENEYQDNTNYNDIAEAVARKLQEKQPSSPPNPFVYPATDPSYFGAADALGITTLDYFAAKEKAALTAAYVVDEHYSMQVNRAAKTEGKTHHQILSESAYTGAHDMLEERIKWIKQ